MATLPIRTVPDDIKAVAGYLSKKPTGATVVDAKKVLDSKYLDGRKLSALKTWGILEESDGRLKLTEEGRTAARDNGQALPLVLKRAIGRIEPYRAIVERAAHRKELSVTATEVAVHWHEHFAEQASDNDRILNDQAVCFFQIAAAAGLGEVVIGRHGNPTRFEFDEQAIADFIDDDTARDVDESVREDAAETSQTANAESKEGATPRTPAPAAAKELGQAIFVAHGKNKKPLEQLKLILDQG